MKADERDILRRLASDCAAAAAVSAERRTAEQWRRLNDLKPVRPLLWVNEICWNEFDSEELRVRCAAPHLAEVELEMRRQLYCWRHFPGDMAVDPVWFSRPVYRSTGYGIGVNEESVVQGAGDISSHAYIPVIAGEEDIDRIEDPVVTVDREETRRRHEELAAAFGDILPVVPGGIDTMWYAPWDILVRWWGVTEALTDLVVRPELVHAAMRRFTDASLAELRQLRELGLLSVGTGNYRVGSGGLGFSEELKTFETAPLPVDTTEQWGSATAQIFGSVGPDMHEEFALSYEREWLRCFKFAYYGCCEPLDRKMAILRSVPNLRKISASPWCDLERLLEAAGTDYVISLKPNPEIFAHEKWNPVEAEACLRRSLDILRSARVEVIVKDLSTLRGEPGRLEEYMAMAARVCGEY